MKLSWDISRTGLRALMPQVGVYGNLSGVEDRFMTYITALLLVLKITIEITAILIMCHSNL